MSSQLEEDTNDGNDGDDQYHYSLEDFEAEEEEGEEKEEEEENEEGGDDEYDQEYDLDFVSLEGGRDDVIDPSAEHSPLVISESKNDSDGAHTAHTAVIVTQVTTVDIGIAGIDKEVAAVEISPSPSASAVDVVGVDVVDSNQLISSIGSELLSFEGNGVVFVDPAGAISTGVVPAGVIGVIPPVIDRAAGDTEKEDDEEERGDEYSSSSMKLLLEHCRELKEENAALVEQVRIISLQQQSQQQHQQQQYQQQQHQQQQHQQRGQLPVQQQQEESQLLLQLQMLLQLQIPEQLRQHQQHQQHLQSEQPQVQQHLQQHIGLQQQQLDKNLGHENEDENEELTFKPITTSIDLLGHHRIALKPHPSDNASETANIAPCESRDDPSMDSWSGTFSGTFSTASQNLPNLLDLPNLSYLHDHHDLPDMHDMNDSLEGRLEGLTVIAPVAQLPVSLVLNGSDNANDGYITSPSRSAMKYRDGPLGGNAIQGDSAEGGVIPLLDVCSTPDAQYYSGPAAPGTQHSQCSIANTGNTENNRNSTNMRAENSRNSRSMRNDRNIREDRYSIIRTERGLSPASRGRERELCLIIKELSASNIRMMKTLASVNAAAVRNQSTTAPGSAGSARGISVDASAGHGKWFSPVSINDSSLISEQHSEQHSSNEESYSTKSSASNSNRGRGRGRNEQFHHKKSDVCRLYFRGRKSPLNSGEKRGYRVLTILRDSPSPDTTQVEKAPMNNPMKYPAENFMKISEENSTKNCMKSPMKNPMKNCLESPMKSVASPPSRPPSSGAPYSNRKHRILLLAGGGLNENDKNNQNDDHNGSRNDNQYNNQNQNQNHSRNYNHNDRGMNSENNGGNDDQNHSQNNRGNIRGNNRGANKGDGGIEPKMLFQSDIINKNENDKNNEDNKNNEGYGDNEISLNKNRNNNVEYEGTGMREENIEDKCIRSYELRNIRNIREINTSTTERKKIKNQIIYPPDRLETPVRSVLTGHPSRSVRSVLTADPVRGSVDTVRTGHSVRAERSVQPTCTSITGRNNADININSNECSKISGESRVGDLGSQSGIKGQPRDRYDDGHGGEYPFDNCALLHAGKHGFENKNGFQKDGFEGNDKYLSLRSAQCSKVSGNGSGHFYYKRNSNDYMQYNEISNNNYYYSENNANKDKNKIETMTNRKNQFVDTLADTYYKDIINAFSEDFIVKNNGEIIGKIIAKMQNSENQNFCLESTAGEQLNIPCIL